MEQSTTCHNQQQHGHTTIYRQPLQSTSKSGRRGTTMSAEGGWKPQTDSDHHLHVSHNQMATLLLAKHILHCTVAEWLRAWDTLTMFKATVCGRS